MTICHLQCKLPRPFIGNDHMLLPLPDMMWLFFYQGVGRLLEQIYQGWSQNHGCSKAACLERCR